MNKKGQTELLIVIGLIILITLFVAFGGFKLASKLNEVPNLIWYALIIIILWRIFSKK